jgi:competence ComEA-like helix-hairpin-helix protein
VVVAVAGLEIASAGRRGMQVREPTVRRAAEPADVRVDLNRAEAFELEQLPGIGPKRAADIIAWRRTHGAFRRPEDVMRIKGIKEGIFRQIAPHVRVSAPTEPAAGLSASPP